MNNVANLIFVRLLDVLLSHRVQPRYHLLLNYLSKLLGELDCERLVEMREWFGEVGYHSKRDSDLVDLFLLSRT